MPKDSKSVLLVSMPFSDISIPSIQLGLLSSYLINKDIKVGSKNLYLKAADFYGFKNYNSLINSPNDSYAAQMIFSKHIFPKHFKENIEKFSYYYENIIVKNNSNLKDFSFENYISKTDEFLDWCINKVDWKSYDIIGFSLNYGQFLPSLAFAKKIKEKNQDKKIILGGSTSINKLGKRIIETFDYIDLIVSGEGEDALYELSINFDKYDVIPGVIYKKNGKTFLNENDKYIDLDSLPIPDYSSYLNDINTVSPEIIQYYQLNGRLPVELSRGCWWNKCTFCNVNIYGKKYRQKKINRFVDELNFLSEKYKILEFQVISNALPKNQIREFCNSIINLKKDFKLYTETRAGYLKSDDYQLLKKAGFRHIQTGIESFSPSYLLKMNKGARVIDNIAALKFCRENNIKNSYNIIINYPNEEKNDFIETIENISLIKKYIQPPQISNYYVGYKSPIYENQRNFNIKNLQYKIIDTIIFPENILEKNFCFFNSYSKIIETCDNRWKQIVKNWENEYEQQQILAVKSDKDVDKFVFYYLDGNNFIKIYDKRNDDGVLIYNLNEDERKIFLSCRNVSSFNEIVEKNRSIKPDKIKEILDDFVDAKIFFREKNYYLSLPLKIVNNGKKNIQTEEKNLVETGLLQL